MENNTTFYRAQTEAPSIVKQAYAFMALALLLSGAIAYLFGTRPEMGELVYYVAKNKPHFTTFGWVALLSPFAIILLMGGTANSSASSGVTVGLFVLLAICEGLSLSTVFITYTHASITLCFVVSAGMFAITSAYGYLTGVDLTKLGNILFMALIGLILALVVNMLLKSPVLDYILSGLGVILFTGLIAYDSQKLKQIPQQADADDNTKLAVFAALSLYLDFINLFLYLLRFLGNRKD